MHKSFESDLEELSQAIVALPYADPFPWDKSVRQRVSKIVGFIENHLGDPTISEPNIHTYLVWINHLSFKKDAETRRLVKRRFTTWLDSLWKQPNIRNNQLLFLRQDFHEHSKEFMFALTDEAVSDEWDDQTFDRFFPDIDFRNTKQGDKAVFNKLIEHLLESRREAEKTKNDRAYNRSDRLYKANRTRGL